MATAAQRAVTDINAIIDRMEIPLLVKENPKEGKHVIAKTALTSGQVVFEEVPVVCWPFTTIDCNAGPRDFCMHCLRRLSEPASSSAATKTETFTCEDCKVAQYCSAECQKKSGNTHSVICGLEAKLREFHVAEETENNDVFPSGVEALARCVALIFIRYLSAQAQNPDATVSELFEAASTTINRFIEPPKESEFEGFQVGKWCDFLRATMMDQMLSFFGDKKEDIPRAQTEVVTALLSDATLTTLLGQITVNAQGLNLVNPAPEEKEEEDTARSERKSETKGEKEEEITDTDGTDFNMFRVTAGAGLYTIQSCFNHSCEPNAVVQYGENSEIKVVILRDTEAGQPVNITYISPLYLAFENVAQRRARLASYFFTCQCPKCLEEDRALAEAEANVNEETKEKE